LVYITPPIRRNAKMSSTKQNSKVNRNLKAEIIRKFGAQYNFAAALGIRESFISSITQGHDTLSDDAKKRWAHVLGVSVKKLFPEDGANV
jgi:transcriptional regulator with XRE-family HTH domain